MKNIAILGLCSLAILPNIANAKMCQDFDDDFNIVEYECGTSLQDAIKIKQESVYQNEIEFDKYLGGSLIFVPSASIGDDYDVGSGYGVAFSVGLQYKKLRSELELKYITGMEVERSYDLYASYMQLTDKYSSVTAMINLYLDVATFGKFTPYVSAGAGMGVAFLNASDRINYDDGLYAYTESFEENESAAVFVYNVGAGVSYKINGSLSLNLAYKFNASSDVFYSPVSGKNQSLVMHELSLGSKIVF